MIVEGMVPRSNGGGKMVIAIWTLFQSLCLPVCESGLNLLLLLVEAVSSLYG